MRSSNQQVPLPGQHRPQSAEPPSPARLRAEVAGLLGGLDEDTGTLAGLLSHARVLEEAHEMLVSALNAVDKI